MGQNHWLDLLLLSSTMVQPIGFQDQNFHETMGSSFTGSTLALIGLSWLFSPTITQPRFSSCPPMEKDGWLLDRLRLKLRLVASLQLQQIFHYFVNSTIMKDDS